MLRRLQVAGGRYACHVLDRAAGRMRLLGKERDCEAFEEVMGRPNPVGRCERWGGASR